MFQNDVKRRRKLANWIFWSMSKNIFFKFLSQILKFPTKPLQLSTKIQQNKIKK